MWRASTYNDGNGCGSGSVGQAQRRPIHALEVLAANGVQGGICNVFAEGRGVSYVKIFLTFGV